MQNLSYIVHHTGRPRVNQRECSLLPQSQCSTAVHMPPQMYLYLCHMDSQATRLSATVSAVGSARKPSAIVVGCGERSLGA